MKKWNLNSWTKYPAKHLPAYQDKKELDMVLGKLKKYPPLQGNIQSIKTAVLWKKKDSTFEPDYCAQKLDSNPWIVQPFEHYEEVRVEDLIKKHRRS